VAHIHIKREHQLGLAGARKLAFKWAEAAEQNLDMECTYEEGKAHDVVNFKRTGASGELQVTKDTFVLDAKLGMLLGVFKDRIETEIVKNLDRLLAEKDPHKAFEQGLKKHLDGEKAEKAEKPAKAAAKKAK